SRSASLSVNGHLLRDLHFLPVGAAGQNQQPLPCKGCSGGVANVPARGQMRRRAGETTSRQLPLIIAIVLLSTACDGLETSWRQLPCEGLPRRPAKTASDLG